MIVCHRLQKYGFPEVITPVRLGIWSCQKLREFRLAWSFIVFLLALSASSSVLAAPKQHAVYCPYFKENTCYSTLAEAEVAIRTGPFASRPEHKYLGKIWEEPQADGTTKYHYIVLNQPPERMNNIGYTGGVSSAFPGIGQVYCSSANPELGDHACADEAELISGSIGYLSNPDRNAPCIASNFQTIGGYASSFWDMESSGVNSDIGYIFYRESAVGTRKVTYNYACPSGLNETRDFYIDKNQGYKCPLGLQAIPGGFPRSAKELAFSSGKMCYSDTTGWIIAVPVPGQVGGCAANGHPCYPATGDKTRFESDFEFAGRAFLRSYHSLQQVAMQPMFAPGWVHSYSDRVRQVPGQGQLELLRDDGFIERFSRISGTSRYASMDDAEKVISHNVDGSYTFSDGTGVTRAYDYSGRLLSVDGGNWKVMLAYASDGLATATDLQGRQLVFEYVAGRLDAIRLPDGGYVRYSYDLAGNLGSVLYPDGRTRTYLYNEPGYVLSNDQHALTGIVDEAGTRYATFKYNTDGYVISSELHGLDGPVEKTVLEYIDESEVRVTKSNGEELVYSINSLSGMRRVESVTSSRGAISQNYNGTLVSEQVDRSGIVTRYDYGPEYRSARYDAYGTSHERKTVFVRDSAFRIQSETVQAKSGTSYVSKRLRSWTYNARGQVLTSTTTDPATSTSRVVTTTYCEQVDVTAGTCPLAGLVKSVNGPRTDVADTTTYSYRMADAAGCATSPSTCAYRKGDLWKTTNAFNQITEVLSVNAYGNPQSILDVNNVVTEYEYDSRGRLLASKVRGPDNGMETDDRIARLEYWPTGLVKKATAPDGSFVTYQYDDAHRMTGIVDAEGNRVAFALNAAGERTREEILDFSGTVRRLTSFGYDGVGLLQTRTDAYDRTTRYSYDANGRIDITIDALGRKADNDFDPLGRPSRIRQDIEGIAAETSFVHDVLDNLVRVTDPKGLNTQYTHNGFGNLTQLVSPDTGTTTYTYDSAGNRKTEKNANNKTTTYTYDALNRVTGVAFKTSSLNVAYVYDTVQSGCPVGETFSIGRLSRMTDGSGNTVYCYDRFGNLARKIQTTNAKTFTFRYSYDIAGRRASVVYPDGAVVDYVRDPLGRVVEVGARAATGARQVLLGSASYYPFGPAAQWTYGNGRTMLRTLNLNYDPGIVQDQSAGGIGIGYEFDEVGNLRRLRDGNQSEPPRRVYDYDGLNRLVASRDGASNALLQGYAYDKTGNRASATVDAATTTYAYSAGSHRLSSVGATVRSYDSAGNTVQIGGTAKQFVYADHNRMTQYKEGSTVRMNYVYNGRGEMVRKYASTAANTYSLYDEEGRWLGDYDNNGVATQQLIWLDGQPVGMFSGSGLTQKLLYVQADAIGTPRTVIDPSKGSAGMAIWTWDLAGEAFGTTAPNQDPDADGTAFVLILRFPGQRHDTVSGLTYNYFRDYEVATGRFVQSDPIGLNGGVSTYGYVNGAPLNWSDPSGLVRWDGKVFPTGLAFVISASAYAFDLTSQCVKGRKARVLVLATAVGLGWGFKLLPPINGTQDNVSLEDHLSDIYPRNFNGLFGVLSGGAVAGRNFGASCNFFQLGSEWTPAVTPWSRGCSLGGAGVGLGVTLGFGSSELAGVRWSGCSDCGPIDTPFK